jgi:hypothetical protein
LSFEISELEAPIFQLANFHSENQDEAGDQNT